MEHGEREIEGRKYLCDEFIINGFQVSSLHSQKKSGVTIMQMVIDKDDRSSTKPSRCLIIKNATSNWNIYRQHNVIVSQIKNSSFLSCVYVTLTAKQYKTDKVDLILQYVKFFVFVFVFLQIYCCHHSQTQFYLSSLLFYLYTQSALQEKNVDSYDIHTFRFPVDFRVTSYWF